MKKIFKIIRIVIACIVYSLALSSCATEDYHAVVGQIEGTVLDANTNNPIRGCQIISDNYGTKHSDDNGHFVFENISPGTIILKYQCNGYESETRTVNVSAGQQTSANISLTPTNRGNGLKPHQTILDFGNRTEVLDLILTNILNTTISYSIKCETNEIHFDPQRGSIIAGRDAIIKVSVDRSSLSEGHYEKVLTIETAEGSSDIQIVFDKGNVMRPVVKTVSLSQSTTTLSRIMAEGAVTVIGSSAALRHGFCYSMTADPTLEENDGCTNLGSLNAPGKFTGMISDLEIDKEYRVRAYATNKEGTGYGDVLKITLKQKDMIDIITEAAANITESTALLKGSVKEGKITDFSELGFYYGITPDCNQKISDIKMESNTIFTASISGLSKDTEYYFRSYGVYDGGEKHGDINTFRTPKATSSSEIICITSDATDIQTTSAKLNGTITCDGKTKIKEWGFYYGTNSNPTKRKVGKTFGSPTVIESQFVSVSISDLSENQEYYFTIYVIDENNNVIKGSINSFITNTTPIVIIEALRYEAIPKEDYYFKLEGRATLYPQGKNVVEAGFLCRVDGSDITYNGSSETPLIYSSGTYRLVCEIEDNIISGSTKVRYVGSYGINVRAYMLLANGTVIYNDKVTLSNGSIYVSQNSSYTRK